ncbi:MAG: hypothetical protein ABSG74_10565 [Candidatus Bathyarchaeia archaeon]|jgi:hypothetical protein
MSNDESAEEVHQRSLREKKVRIEMGLDHEPQPQRSPAEENMRESLTQPQPTPSPDDAEATAPSPGATEEPLDINAEVRLHPQLEHYIDDDRADGLSDETIQGLIPYYKRQERIGDEENMVREQLGIPKPKQSKPSSLKESPEALQRRKLGLPPAASEQQ